MRAAPLLIALILVSIAPALGEGPGDAAVTQFADGVVLLKAGTGPAVYEVPVKGLGVSSETVIYVDVAVAEGTLKLGLYGGGWVAGPVAIGGNKVAAGSDSVQVMTSAILRMELVIYRGWAAFLKLIDYYRNVYYSIKLPLAGDVAGSLLRFESDGTAYVIRVRQNDVALFSAYQDMEEMADYPSITAYPVRVKHLIIDGGLIKAEELGGSMSIWYLGEDGVRCWANVTPVRHGAGEADLGISYVEDVLVGWAKYTPNGSYVGEAKYAVGNECRLGQEREVETTIPLALAGKVYEVIPLKDTVVIFGSERVVFINLLTGDEVHTDEPGTPLAYGAAGVVILSGSSITYYSSDGREVWAREVVGSPHALVLSNSAVVSDNGTVFVIGEEGGVTEVSIGAEVVGLAWDGSHVVAAAGNTLYFIDPTGGVISEVSYSGEYLGLGPGDGYATLVYSVSNGSDALVTIADASPGGVEVVMQYPLYRRWARSLEADAGWGRAVIKVGFTNKEYLIYITSSGQNLLAAGIRGNREFSEELIASSSEISGIYIPDLDSLYLTSPRPSLVRVGLRPESLGQVLWLYEGTLYVLDTKYLSWAGKAVTKLASISPGKEPVVTVENISVCGVGGCSAKPVFGPGGRVVAYAINYDNGTVRYGLLGGFENRHDLGLPRLGRDQAYVTDVLRLGDGVMVSAAYVVNGTRDTRVIVGYEGGGEVEVVLGDVIRNYYGTHFGIDWGRVALSLETDSIAPSPDMSKVAITGRAHLIATGGQPTPTTLAMTSFIIVLDAQGRVLEDRVVFSDSPISVAWVNDTALITLGAGDGLISLIDLRSGEERVLARGDVPRQVVGRGADGLLFFVKEGGRPIFGGYVLGPGGGMVRLVRWLSQYYDIIEDLGEAISLGAGGGFYVMASSAGGAVFSTFIRVSDWHGFYDYTLINASFRLECEEGYETTQNLSLLGESGERTLEVGCGQSVALESVRGGKIRMMSPEIGTYPQQFLLIPGDWGSQAAVKEESIVWVDVEPLCIRPDNLHRNQAVMYYVDGAPAATYPPNDLTGQDPDLCISLELGNHTVVAYVFSEAYYPSRVLVWDVTILPPETELEVITPFEGTTTSPATSTTTTAGQTETSASTTTGAPAAAPSPYAPVVAVSAAAALAVILMLYRKRKRGD